MKIRVSWSLLSFGRDRLDDLSQFEFLPSERWVEDGLTALSEWRNGLSQEGPRDDRANPDDCNGSWLIDSGVQHELKLSVEEDTRGSGLGHTHARTKKAHARLP